jgi:hypothetical protein
MNLLRLVQDNLYEVYYIYKKYIGVHKIIIFACYFTMV